MPFDKFKMPEELSKERRKRIQQSLRSISIDELKSILKQHEEEFVDDPWREEFLRLMAAQPPPSFEYAEPQEDVVVYYCRDADFGVWVVPGSGMGPLDATGKRLMKEAIANRLSGRKIGEKR